jgi:hypothetical protein
MADRNWIVTYLPAYNELFEQANQIYDTTRMCYLIVGLTHDDEGEPAWRYYIEFKNWTRLSALNKIFNTVVRAMPRRNTQANIIQEIKNSDLCIEVGEPKKQGTRTDLQAIIDSCSTIEDVQIYHPEIYCRYRNGLNDIYLQRNTQTTFIQKTVIWFWGPTGTGKTRRAFEEAPDAWISTRDLQWFNGYHGQNTVIIDDFRKEFCPFPTLLRLLDGYPLSVPIKGGFVNWVPNRVYVTSCYSPATVYNGLHEDVRQLLRRITAIIYFENVGGEWE